jgi:hypothetical protein
MSRGTAKRSTAASGQIKSAWFSTGASTTELTPWVRCGGVEDLTAITLTGRTWGT